jgi:hypothetical protein
MDSDFKDMLPGSLQAYANFGMAVVVIIVGAIGYYRKMRGEGVTTANLATVDRLTDRYTVTVGWLQKIYDGVMLVNGGIVRMIEIQEERDRKDELEKEYRRGRDEASDRYGRQSRERERERDDHNHVRQKPGS